MPDAASSSPWPDLPVDLLRDISDSLQAATDYVHFHAVCKPWRDTLLPPQRRPAILPWLVGRREADGHLKVRCVFSSKWSPRRAVATEIRVPDRRWVISTNDGTATSWLRTSSGSQSSSCRVEPLTGSAAATPVPGFRDVVDIKTWEGRAVGVSSGDGAVVLYAYGLYSWNGHRYGINVALRRPEDTEWTLVQTNDVFTRGECCLAYRNGKIILCDELRWRVVSMENPKDGADDDGDWRWMLEEPGKEYVSSHLVESGEELLWAFVQVNRDFPYRDSGNVGTISNLARALSVSVYALQEAEDRELQWVRRDRSSICDRVLFLGQTASFSVDAGRYGMSGRGCAYFIARSRVYGGLGSKWPLTRCRVFKYSFIDDTAELVEQLPKGWTDQACRWITPQLAIAPTEEIRERIQPTHKKAPRPQPQVWAYSRIFVENLSRKVDSYQLQQFFSNHGKVADARVMHEKRAGRSQGFGFVIMGTTTEEKMANTIAKLHGQCLDGRPLRVKFANQQLVLSS